MPQQNELKTAVRGLKKRVEDLKTDMAGVREEVKDATTTLLPGRLGVIRQRFTERRRLIKDRLEKSTVA